MFGGKRYELWNLTPITKAAATMEAKRIRGQNQPTRVVKLGDGYFLYIRPPRRMPGLG